MAGARRAGPEPLRRILAAVVAFMVVVALVLLVRLFVFPQEKPPSGGPALSPSASASSSSEAPSSPSSPVPSAPGQGKQVAVAPNGDDDGKGTLDDPWRTLEQALPSLRAGDTLVVADGTYDEQLTDLDLHQGTRERPIHVVAAPDSDPLIRGLLWLRNADYWRVSGINVTWSSDNSESDHMVKFDGGRNWSFTDAEVWKARSYAAILVTGDARHWSLTDLFVHSTQRTHSNNQDHLIYVSSSIGGGLIEHCLLIDSPNGRGIKIGPPDNNDQPVGNVVIRYNTFYDNRGPSNIQLSQGATRNRIYRNILVRPDSDSPNVSAYRLSGSGNEVRDNLVYDSRQAMSKDVKGLRDLGGNLERDPRFRDPGSNDFHPLDKIAQAYGRYAG